MTGQILPPREPIADTDTGNVTAPWYRYLVARKRITDAMTSIGSIIVGPVTPGTPNSRQIAVTSPITATDAGAGSTYTLGLADSGVTADTYGDATHLVVIAIDAKGRVTTAAEYALNSDNVTEGAANLFFTNARARASVSATSPLSYNSGTGIFSVTGAALTKSDDTNVTLTLGGSPATSLLVAASLTLGWAGTLSVARGGTGTTGPFTVAGLPAVGTPWLRAFVTDALAPAFAAIVVGGGAVSIPVYSDGTNWRVG